MFAYMMMYYVHVCWCNVTYKCSQLWSANTAFKCINPFFFFLNFPIGKWKINKRQILIDMWKKLINIFIYNSLDLFRGENLIKLLRLYCENFTYLATLLCYKWLPNHYHTIKNHNNPIVNQPITAIVAHQFKKKN